MAASPDEATGGPIIRFSPAEQRASESQAGPSASRARPKRRLDRVMRSLGGVARGLVMLSAAGKLEYGRTVLRFTIGSAKRGSRWVSRKAQNSG